MIPDNNKNLQDYYAGNEKLPAAIKQMGYEKLREGQEQPVHIVMSGRDAFCILPTSAGKCFGKDTEVLMADGSIKKVQDVEIGDRLIGAERRNSYPKVTSLTRGHGQLYRVSTYKNTVAPFVVNEDHVMVVAKDPDGKEVVEMTVKEIMELPQSKQKRQLHLVPTNPITFRNRKYCWQEDGKAYTAKEAIIAAYECAWSVHLSFQKSIKEDTQARIPECILYGTLPVRKAFAKAFLSRYYKVDGMCQTPFHICFSYHKIFLEDLAFLLRSLGIMVANPRLFNTVKKENLGTSFNVQQWVLCISKNNLVRLGVVDRELSRFGARRCPTFKVEPIGEGDYYGFSISGKSQRFVLANGTVTHNSACYALPTIAMNWKTVVFSPLIALMRDQVQSMNNKGITAACVNSSQTEMQNYQAMTDWVSGKLQMLYAAPERLEDDRFRHIFEQVKPDFVVMDEAHTISQWSHAFRPAYRKCGEFVRDLAPRIVSCYTATATKQIVEDVKEVLGLDGIIVYRYYPPRNNLHFSSSRLLDEELYPAILAKVREVKGCVIVYCQTTMQVEDLAGYLSNAGESVTYYHGRMQEADRAMNQDAFMGGRARICVATNAFGMGIDKPDIEAIIHAGPPTTIEAVVQETGRAARDGREAHCHMFCTPRGEETQAFFWDSSNPKPDSLTQVYNFLKERVDAANVAQVTVKQMEDAEIENAQSALSALTSLGCVERFKQDGKVYTIVDYNKSEEDMPAPLRPLIHAIRPLHGEQVGGNKTVYRVDLAYLVNKVSQSEATVKGKFKKLKDGGFADIIAPFKGKSTKLIHYPEEEDLKKADERRSTEFTKLQKVREYFDVPDEEKQAFLLKYFDREFFDM